MVQKQETVLPALNPGSRRWHQITPRPKGLVRDYFSVFVGWTLHLGSSERATSPGTVTEQLAHLDKSSFLTPSPPCTFPHM